MSATTHGPRANRWTPRRWGIALALLVVATFLVRARYYGDPFIDVDEEFYLLVGDRMLHGSIPYVDIWDRKPVGLFLIYAAIRLLGGGGIVQYQLVASAFAAATAVVIACAGRRIASPGAALVAACAYIPALAMNGGAGGQAPVFYNLPMAVAGWLVLRLAMERPDSARICRTGMGVMLLVGVAMQIKYTALFEGVFFGLALIWLGWRAAPRRVGLVFAIGLWVGVALLPTLLALAAYAGMGQAQAFIYANFLSIGQRGSESAHHQWHDLRHILIRLLPFLIVIAAGLALRREARAEPRVGAGRRFVLGWLGAAIFGFAIFGSYFNHYALPLLVPLAIAAAPALTVRRGWIGRLLGAMLLLAMLVPYPLAARAQDRRRGDAAYARAITAQIAPRLHGRCLYVFFGEPILYHLTRSCLPSRWAFPFHLGLQREAPALGVDPVTEARRIMATYPPVVVDRLNRDRDVNRAVQGIVRQHLARDYHLAWSFRHGARKHPATDRVWVLNGQR